MKAAVGTVLFRPEQPCAGFLIVRAGTIRVGLTAANGREVVLYRVGPGDVCLQTFACLYSGAVYSAEGVVETALDAELIPAAQFRQKLANDGAFRDAVFGAVARRFGEFEALVETLALQSLEVRLARALLRLADDQGQVKATHEALAAETASARAAISRELRMFADRGLVRLQRGAVVISDRAGLSHLAFPSV